MIYVTGDTHGNIDFKKLKIFAKQHKNLNKDDYVIIAGDFGGVWSEETLDYDLKEYEKLPFTVLFVDGNHENFNIINSFPVEKWHKGKVHKISPNIIHLMRGQVFEINGKTFFTFGGGTSVDKAFRKPNLSWWEAELPSEVELNEGLENLKRYDNQVDFIITHSCDTDALSNLPYRASGIKMKVYKDNEMLSVFEKTVKYTHWYFGHYHMDGDINDKKTVLYQNIVELVS